jgi:hypothetical protein
MAKGREGKDHPYPNLCKTCGKVAKVDITIPRRLAGYYCKGCKAIVLAEGGCDE